METVGLSELTFKLPLMLALFMASDLHCFVCATLMINPFKKGDITDIFPVFVS